MRNRRRTLWALLLAACVTQPDEAEDLETVAEPEPAHACPPASVDVEPAGRPKRMGQLTTLLTATATDDPERPMVELVLARYQLASAAYREGCAALDRVAVGTDAESATVAERLREQHCTDARRRECLVARATSEAAR